MNIPRMPSKHASNQEVRDYWVALDALKGPNGTRQVQVYASLEGPKPCRARKLWYKVRSAVQKWLREHFRRWNGVSYRVVYTVAALPDSRLRLRYITKAKNIS